MRWGASHPLPIVHLMKHTSNVLGHGVAPHSQPKLKALGRVAPHLLPTVHLMNNTAYVKSAGARHTPLLLDDVMGRITL
jgi:hypothetical protein